MSDTDTNQQPQRRAPEPFDGMPAEAFRLLKGLKADNRAGWMGRNRLPAHEHLLNPFLRYLRAVSDQLAVAGHSLGADEGTVFKMQRDVRFSSDKRPYHEHLEAVFSADGRRIGSRAAIHVRFGVDGGFLRAGSFLQPPASLRALREAMRARRSRFLGIAQDLASNGCGLVAAKELKRLPRGFEDVANTELAKWLRLMDPVAERRLSPTDWTSGQVAAATADFADVCRAWLLFQREALQDVADASIGRP